MARSKILRLSPEARRALSRTAPYFDRSLPWEAKAKGSAELQPRVTLGAWIDPP